MNESLADKHCKSNNSLALEKQKIVQRKRSLIHIAKRTHPGDRQTLEGVYLQGRRQNVVAVVKLTDIAGIFCFVALETERDTAHRHCSGV